MSSKRGVLNFVVKSLANAKPLELGLSQLGWNKERTLYSTTTHHISKSDVFAHGGIYLPESKVFENYKFGDDYVENNTVTMITDECTYLLSFIAYGMYKSFIQQPVPVINYQNESNTTSFLQTIFGALGQTGIYKQTPKWLNKFSKQLQGFPLLCFNATDKHLEELVDSVVVTIGRTGRKVSERFDVRNVPAIQQQSRYVVKELGKFILSGRVSNLGLDLNVVDFEAVCREGVKIINATLAVSWETPKSSTPELDKLFTLPLEKINELLKHDWQNQRVQLNDIHKYIPTINLARLSEELAEHKLKISTTADRRIITIPAQFLEVVTDRLPGFNVEPVDTSKVEYFSHHHQPNDNQAEQGTG
jgi:hypothetical protein